MKAVTLCYHKVGTQEQQGRRLNVHPARLKAHVRFFVRRKFRFLTAAELANPWPRRTVCFTFDDAYVSTLENGLPVFDEFGVPASVYAVADRVGETSAWDGPLARPLACWDALLSAQARGHEIGNHSATHAKLTLLGAEEQRAEIVRAHQALVDHGIEPRSFCYPYGALNESAMAAVSECGYKVGMALQKRLAQSSDPLVALPRVVVAYGDALPILLYKLHLRPLLPK
jgi:peptidoglycan/xylan/chitin deacetylase (PgdA/CDA1 family)